MIDDPFDPLLKHVINVMAIFALGIFGEYVELRWDYHTDGGVTCRTVLQIPPNWMAL